MEQLQCWDFKKCGNNVSGGCPAFITHQGQSCWRVEGTFCEDKVQGKLVDKLDNCKKCDFHSYINNNA